MPYVIDGDGNCHVYVDARRRSRHGAVDRGQRQDAAARASATRPSPCSSTGRWPTTFLPRAAGALAGVELVGDERHPGASLPGMGAATDEDFATEFLDLKLAVAVVDDLDGAIDHIARYGSGHSEAIVTGDLRAADRFCREVDAAAVVVNASTRFVDGGELGLGAEIGISTQKLHARGPMGLRELTCVKYVVHGDGQVRR